MNNVCYICGIGKGICSACAKEHGLVPAASPVPTSLDRKSIIDDLDYHMKEEDAIKAAENAGFTIVRGNPRLLTLDLDSSEAIKKFQDMKLMIGKKFRLPSLTHEEWNSKSWKLILPRKHVIVHLPFDMDIEERILFQALLGSDLKRETLNYHKLKFIGIKEPCLLFKPPAPQKIKLS